MFPQIRANTAAYLARIAFLFFPTLFSGGLFAQTCGVTNVTPLNSVFGVSGGTGTATVQITGSGCSWSASLVEPESSWMSLLGTASGTAANGAQVSVSYAAAANPGPLPEAGALKISVTGGAAVVFGFGEASPDIPPIVWSCTNLNGPTTVGVAYANTCTASGGTPPYVPNVVNGSLPGGLSASYTSNSITISGTPTAAGAYSYTLQVVDSTTIQGEFADQAYSGTISAGGFNCSFSTGTQGTNQSFGSAGGSGSFSFVPASNGCSWSAAAGASWVTLQTPDSGTTSAGSQVSVAFTVAANTGSTSRSAILTVTLAGGATATFGIQEAAPSTALTLACSSGAGPSQVGVAYSDTCTGSGGTPPYLFQFTGGTLPPGITSSPVLNGIAVSGTPTQAGPYNYTISMNDSGAIQQASSQAFSGTIAAAACTLSTGNQALTQAFSAAGGPGSASATPSSSGCPWTATSNVSWITIQGTGSGTSTASVAIGVSFAVANNSTSSSRSGVVTIGLSSGATAAYTIQQSQSSVTGVLLQCSTAAGPAQIGVAYTATCTVSGGAGPYSFAISGGSLPAGLQSSTTSNAVTISGTPSVTGNYGYTVSATDSETTPQSATQSFAGTIAAGVVAMSCTTALGPSQAGLAYSDTCTATGGLPPYRFVVSNSPLPAGLATSTNGNTFTVAGAPNAVGDYRYIISAIDSEVLPQSASQTFQGSVVPASGPLSVSCSMQTGPVQVGVSYSVTCTASGGVAPYSFQISGGVLPAGLTSFSTSTSIMIYGSPTQAGSYSYGVFMTDREAPQKSASQTFAGTVAAQGPSLSLNCTTQTGPAQVGVAYSATCSASGGVTPYSFLTGNGPLPAGLTSSTTATSITVHGSPTAVGSYTYTVSVTDHETPPQTVPQTFTGTIAPASSQCAAGSNPVSGVGLNVPPYNQPGYGFVSLTFNAPNCPWSVSSSASWLTFVQPSGVLGSAPSQAANLMFATEPNTGAAPRVAVLTVSVNGNAAATTSFTQNSSSCTYSLSPQNLHLTAAGGPANLALTVSPAKCVVYFTGPGWPATIGQGSVSFFVPPNTGSARTETMLFGAIAGAASGPQATVTITQDAGGPGMPVTCGQSSPYASASELFQVLCEVVGGVAPYQWSIGGSPPPGLTPQPSSGASWLLSASPPAGPYNFTVTVTDSTAPKPLTSTSLPIAGTIGPPVLDIQGCSASTPAQGVPYSVTCTTIHGTPPVTWSLTAGALPAGLSYIQSNGAMTISGTPTSSGPFDFTFHVADSSTPPVVRTWEYSGAVLPAPLLVCSPLVGPSDVGVKYTATCMASGGVPPYSWLQPETLPSGISLTVSADTATATISGIPQIALSYDYAVTVSDSTPGIALSATQEYKGSIGFATAPKLSVSPSSLQFNSSASNPPANGVLTQTLSVFSSVAGLPFKVQPSNIAWDTTPPVGNLTPANVQVSVNVQGMQPGMSYADSLIISAPDANPPVIQVPVLVTIAAGPPVLDISPTQYTWPAVAGSPPLTRQIGVFNSGGGILAFSVSTSGGSWLSAGVASGTAVMDQPAILSYTIDPAGLVPGTYTAKLVITTLDGAQSIPVIVNLIVNSAPAAISLTPNYMSFTATAGGAAPPPQTLGILNAGQGTFTWSINAGTLSGGPWLSSTPSTGTSTAGGTVGSSTIAVDPGQLAPGTYYGTIYVFAATAPSAQSMTVVLNVLPANQNQPPQASPAGLLLTAAAPSATLTLTNFGTQPMAYSSTTTTNDGGNWLSVSPSNGSIGPGPFGAAVSASADLPAGVWQGQVRIAFGDGTVSNVSVTMVVPAGGPSQSAARRLSGPGSSQTAACVASRLVPLFTSIGPGFTLTAGQPVDVQAIVVDDCANPVSGGSLALQTSTGDAGAGLNSVGGGLWQATWTPFTPSLATSLTMAALQGSLIGEMQLQGSIAPSPAGSAPQITSVVNSASYASAGEVPSGTWISIFGNNLADSAQSASGGYPALLQGTQVLIGSTSLPLQYAGPKQINALLPGSVPANSVQSMVVERDGTASAPALVTVADYLPAIYSMNQLGSGQGAILIANTASIAAPSGAFAGSRPAQRGEYLEIYAGGLGPTSNAPVNGAPAPGAPNLAATLLQPSVTIGGVPAAAVVYSGLSPGEVGLYQIDVQVPASVVPGNAVPVVVTMNGKDSNTVTIAVQ